MNLFGFVPGYGEHIYGSGREPAFLMRLALAFEPREFWVAFLAAAFGAGAALVLDEFAMLLHLDDVYWTTEGRLSIDACLAAIAFLALAVLATFPLSSDSAGDRLGRSIADGLLVLNVCLVTVTFL